MKPLITISLMITLALLITGCASPDDPAQVVEQYFSALIDDDTDRLSQITCPAYEGTAQSTAASFRNTGATLENMHCSLTQDSNIVSCQGKIVVPYQAELREFPLGAYHVEQIDGTWRMCGETEAQN